MDGLARTGSSKGDGVELVFCLSSGLSGEIEGVSGVLSLQAVFVHGGWKLLFTTEPKPVPPQFPHKKPVPVPDGWGSWLYAGFPACVVSA